MFGHNVKQKRASKLAQALVFLAHSSRQIQTERNSRACASELMELAASQLSKCANSGSCADIRSRWLRSMPSSASMTDRPYHMTSRERETSREICSSNVMFIQAFPRSTVPKLQTITCIFSRASEVADSVYPHADLDARKRTQAFSATMPCNMVIPQVLGGEQCADGLGRWRFDWERTESDVMPNNSLVIEGHYQIRGSKSIC